MNGPLDVQGILAYYERMTGPPDPSKGFYLSWRMTPEVEQTMSLCRRCIVAEEERDRLRAQLQEATATVEAAALIAEKYGKLHQAVQAFLEFAESPEVTFSSWCEALETLNEAMRP